MEPHDMNVTNMLWRPKLLRLTQVRHPAEDGAPDIPEGPAYVDPQDIIAVQSTTVKFKGDGSTILCTSVRTHIGYLNVTESCEQVAKMRDEAFGHAEPKGPRAVT